MAHIGLKSLDLAFSFDTTGSMYGVLDEVRKNIAEMLQRLSDDIPEIRVALIAHGDYGDVYETKIQDFGTATADLVHFVNTVSRTGGSDTPECYELVLQQARTHLTWRKNSTRVLVLIGDSYPHEVGSSRNKYKIDWKAEVELLRQLGVTVYCVQCHIVHEATSFMDHVAKATGGLRLPLAEIRGVRDFLMAIAYREGGSEQLQDVYEHEVRAREGAGLSGDVSHMLGLVRRTSSTSAAGTGSSAAKPITAARNETKTAVRRAKAAKPTVAVVRATPMNAKKVVKISTAVAGSERSKTVKAGQARRATHLSKNRLSAKALWSPWRLVGQPGSVPGTSWQQLGSGSVRRSLICANKGSCGGHCAIELAVQPRLGARRLPVFVSVLSTRGDQRYRGLSLIPFGRVLSGRPLVRAQLMRVLRHGMRAFARVRNTGSAAAPVQLQGLAKATSYAWKNCRSVRSSGVFVSVSEKSLRKLAVFNGKL